MKQSSTRELFDYWNARRGERAAPERKDIEPGAIRHLLADTFILAFDPRAGHPFRVAGTRACALLGRELKGAAFLDLWAGKSRGLMSDLINVITHEVIGVVASASGASAEGDALDLELLVLPLRQLGRTDGRVLGALAPTEVTWWLGARPLGGLTLGTLRYVGPAGTPDFAPRAAPDASNIRVRHGLVVYDGGQA
jgi:hypothetical protein